MQVKIMETVERRNWAFLAGLILMLCSTSAFFLFVMQVNKELYSYVHDSPAGTLELTMENIKSTQQDASLELYCALAFLLGFMFSSVGEDGIDKFTFYYQIQVERIVEIPDAEFKKLRVR